MAVCPLPLVNLSPVSFVETGLLLVGHPPALTDVSAPTQSVPQRAAGCHLSEDFCDVDHQLLSNSPSSLTKALGVETSIPVRS